MQAKLHSTLLDDLQMSEFNLDDSSDKMDSNNSEANNSSEGYDS